MSLALVTTASAVNANAYADVASAMALAAYRGAPGAAFLELSGDAQIQALATAAAEIDSYDFSGTKATETQSMEFPRLHVGTTLVPFDVIRANHELAFARAAAFVEGATSDPLTPSVDRVKRDKTGPLETEYFAPTTLDAASLATLPPVVQRLLSRWLRVAVAHGYGTGTAVRGS